MIILCITVKFYLVLHNCGKLKLYIIQVAVTGHAWMPEGSVDGATMVPNTLSSPQYVRQDKAEMQEHQIDFGYERCFPRVFLLFVALLFMSSDYFYYSMHDEGRMQRKNFNLVHSIMSLLLHSREYSWYIRDLNVWREDRRIIRGERKKQIVK